MGSNGEDLFHRAQTFYGDIPSFLNENHVKRDY